VHQERATRLEPNNQILAATIDQNDTLTIQLSRHIEWIERARQPLIRDPNLLEDPTFEHGRKPPANGLDLGELGHRCTVAVPG